MRIQEILDNFNVRWYMDKMSIYHSPPRSVIEHAVAKPGDWDGSNDVITSISQFIFEKQWKIVGLIEVEGTDYTIARFDDQSTKFVLGRMVPMDEDDGVPKTRFVVVFVIEMNKEDRLAKDLGYGNLYSVFSVSVRSNMRGQRIAKTMYKWLVANQHIAILGDKTQYFGARRLWASLSRASDVLVDIVDIKTTKVLEKDVTLHHGEYDHEFDQRVWSYGQEIGHIRLILRDIK